MDYHGLNDWLGKGLSEYSNNLHNYNATHTWVLRHNTHNISCYIDSSYNCKTLTSSDSFLYSQSIIINYDDYYEYMND